MEEHGSSRETHRLLESLVQDGSAIAKVHALWTLAGMGWAHAQPLALQDTQSKLAAIRVAERIAADLPGVIESWVALERGSRFDPLARQVLLSLGNVPGEKALATLLDLVREKAPLAEMRSVAVSGLCGRELDALTAMADSEEWRKVEPGRAELFALLARCIARESRGDRLEGLIALCAGKLAGTKWQLDAVVSGVLDGRPKDALGKPTWIRLARKPSALPDALDTAFAWPGKAGAEELKVRELTPEEVARFEKGRALYESTCVQCHLASGLGQTGQAPPLRSSPWVLGKDVRTARILLQGLRGEVELEGERWDGEMPSVSFSDEDIAAILTYVRREWGNGAEPVLPATIEKVRAATKGRTHPWTLAELELIND